MMFHINFKLINRAIKVSKGLGSCGTVIGPNQRKEPMEAGKQTLTDFLRLVLSALAARPKKYW